jgi:serine/threonine protein kinase/predicted Zn-dependent protease
MYGNVVKLVCPNCAATSSVGADAEAGVCPRCGRALVPTDDTGVRGAGPSLGGGEAGSAGSDAADAMLVANLREAFELEAEALGSAGPCRLGPGSSDAFSRSLLAETLPSGSRLGDFEILAELGRGGMGVVYRARQVSLGREVALKVLPGYARHGPMAVQRFRAEAQAAARLHHTNIVPIYAQGEHGGHFYYAMELVEGVGLDTVIHSRPELLSSTLARRALSVGASTENRNLPAPAAADRQPVRAACDPQVTPATGWTRADYRQLAALVSEVADALECAHRHGVIHRDVKPRNLLLGTNNRLHLTDFGLARLTDEPHLTVSGEVMGTPAYLSPEQVRGDTGRIDHRTDIYSLGVTLYEVLTRRKPFDGETREQIITGICTLEPVTPRRLDPQIPVDLETICLRAMEKEPERRHQSAALLAADLRRFAEGRPILSRRRSRLEKAAKWVRQRKALSATTAAMAVVCLLAVGLAWSISVARQREARQLLRDAYEQLAYFDYRRPELVQADIDHAAALGADPDEVELVWALACLGGTDQAGAIDHLQAVLESDPADLRAWYMLAWAQWRDRQRAAARATFEQAEQRGPPTSPDAWFFRGLAIHFDEPVRAIESYRQAVALGAREHRFYPQAVLHLARARNQQLYVTRSLDAFPEADASLRQLIEQQQYGAYPYYLLSIAHRLAAEIYSGSEGPPDDSLVAEHYAEALEWARRGQDVEPSNDRPITAEAECLESMGRYAEAIEARSRAIAVAVKEPARCEGYHYRWRLYYWTRDLEAALEDVAVHSGCDPQSRFYAHVYPALILAEMGRMQEALGHARALADEAPPSAQAVLWSATCLRLLGQAGEAHRLLAERAEAVDYAAELVPPQSEEWVRALYAYCRDGGSRATLGALAEGVGAPRKLWGEADFHAAALALAEGDRRAALEDLLRAYRSFDGEERYTFHAKLIRTRMQQDPAWPSWIPVSWDNRQEPLTDGEAERPPWSASDEEGGS